MRGLAHARTGTCRARDRAQQRLVRHPISPGIRPPCASSHGRHRLAGQRIVLVRSGEEDKQQENKLGPNVLAGIKEVKENTRWTAGTIIKNECVFPLVLGAHSGAGYQRARPPPCRAVNLDGSLRMLHLSVSEQVGRPGGAPPGGLQGGPPLAPSPRRRRPGAACSTCAQAHGLPPLATCRRWTCCTASASRASRTRSASQTPTRCAAARAA
jgi:hypothetical protein